MRSRPALGRSLLLGLAVATPLAAQAYPRARTGGNYMHNFYFPPAGSSTPWWPSWSPDGRSIAFAMDGSIWTVDFEQALSGEAAARELIHEDRYLSSPEWSPDGNYLAYTADDDGRSIDLMLRDLRTGESTALTQGDHVQVDPAWSPDGRRLAFVSTEPRGYFNVYVMAIESGKPGEVTAVTTDHRFPRSRLYFGANDLHISPTWSPDGSELMFISNRGIPLGSGGIWRTPVGPDVMGSGNAKLIHKEETLYRTRPHWSPDGARIVYSSHLGHQFVNLFVLPSVGGEPYKLTFGEHDSFHPRWSPDGEWIAYISNERGLPQLKLLKSWGGKAVLVELTEKRWSRPMGEVTVRVLGSDGEPTPARIYPTAADGKAYTPSDSYDRLAGLSRHLFHTPGEFATQVPPGTYTVVAVKGFEHVPARASVEVSAGKAHELELTLERTVDLRAKGWYSGSNHVHLNYAGNLHNTPENLFLMNAAEDADVICHQIANKDNRILDYQHYLPGRTLHPLSSAERIMHTGQEYRPPFYGHISLFNLKEHLISPFVTGYEGTAIESLYPSNTDVFRFAKEQGGIGAYVHPFRGDRDPLRMGLGTAKAFPVDVALGALSYHELWSQPGYAGLIVWHHALNNGFRVPATGGEDSISSLHRTDLVGAMRGYFHLGSKPLSWENYVEAMLAGRGFVTNGPLLELAVDGELPGGELRLPAAREVLIAGSVRCIAPLERLEVVRNGETLETIELTGDRKHAEFERKVRVSDSSWFTLQAVGARRTFPIEQSRPMATTNPVYVLIGDRPVRNARSADYFVRWIDLLSGMARAHPGWRSDREREHVLAQFEEARAVYEQRRREAAR